MLDAMRPVVLAELPDGRRLAIQEYGRFSRTYPEEPPRLYLESHNVLMLLGRKEQAIALLKNYRLPRGQLPMNWKALEDKRRFATGELSEEEHLARAGTSRWAQSNAHLEVGLSRLAGGDRAGARSHFQKAVATRAYWYGSYYYAQMFLSRLEKDPTWPPWIPMKQERSKP
jgi:hypothetical protein